MLRGPPSGMEVSAHLSQSDIRAQLARVLNSEAFDASGRNRNFLQYVVEETIAGRAAYIKGYTVAQGVFGRGEDFDPLLDPVVRIEASRLRRSLERYYLTMGKTDPVRIELPKGGYVPRFEKIAADMAPDAEVTHAAEAEVMPSSRLEPGNGPSIVVLPFENLGDDVNGDLLAGGVTEELIGRLLAFKQLNVISANTSFKLSANADFVALGRRFELGYVLKGAMRIIGDRMRISMQLLDVENGQYLWAESFDRELTSDDLWDVQEQVAAVVATRLGAPYGAIANLSRARLARRSEQVPEAYLAILKAYGYRRQWTPTAHAEVRDCLEYAVMLNPACFKVWALLALIYIDEYRFGFNPQPEPLSRAHEAAMQAVRWGSDSALAHLALSLVHHYRYEHDKAHALARHAITLNPDNPEVLAQAAVRLMLSGEWEEGTALLKRAIERDPEPPAWNYIMLTLDSLRRADYQEALTYATEATESQIHHVFVLLCVIYNALGEQEQATAALDEACSEGCQWSELWEQLRRSIHDDGLLQLIEHGVQQVKSRRGTAAARA